MNKLIAILVMVLSLSSINVGNLAFVGAAVACSHVTAIECNRSSDIVTFSGDRVLKDQIKVTICHTYWDRLNAGNYNGQQTKWWAPVMVYGSWYGDLPVVTQQCHTYWVKPGSEMRLFASCVQRVIKTGVMRKPGTYYLN